MFNEGILRSRITDWRQLPGVMSNNSKLLSIKVSDFVQDSRLTGLRIQVNHRDFGTLFACVLAAEGSIITPLQENITVEITPEAILAELQKYGFYVTYVPHESLSGRQVTYLMTLKDLNYDKIRILHVHRFVNSVKEIEWYVVAFNVKSNPQWINNWYSPSQSEFLSALKNGSAINLSQVSITQKLRWDWLVGWVANIQDIVDSNS